MSVMVRPFEENDTNRLRAICEETAGERPFLPFVDDARFATAFHLDPYLVLEPDSCFVAVADGRIIAYLAGTCDGRRLARQRRAFFPRQLPELLRVQAAGILRFRPLSHRILLRMYVQALQTRDAELPAAGVDLARYPAHCHLQVSPEARARRAGLALMLKFHEHLRARGVPGQCSSVVEPAGHEGYSRMLLALRFRLICERAFTRRERPSLMHAGTWRERVLVREL